MNTVFDCTLQWENEWSVSGDRWPFCWFSIFSCWQQVTWYSVSFWVLIDFVSGRSGDSNEVRIRFELNVNEFRTLEWNRLISESWRHITEFSLDNGHVFGVSPTLCKRHAYYVHDIWCAFNPKRFGTSFFFYERKGCPAKNWSVPPLTDIDPHTCIQQVTQEQASEQVAS